MCLKLISLDSVRKGAMPKNLRNSSLSLSLSLSMFGRCQIAPTDRPTDREGLSNGTFSVQQARGEIGLPSFALVVFRASGGSISENSNGRTLSSPPYFPLSHFNFFQLPGRWLQHVLQYLIRVFNSERSNFIFFFSC